MLRPSASHRAADVLQHSLIRISRGAAGHENRDGRQTPVPVFARVRRRANPLRPGKSSIAFPGNAGNARSAAGRRPQKRGRRISRSKRAHSRRLRLRKPCEVKADSCPAVFTGCRTRSARGPASRRRRGSPPRLCRHSGRSRCPTGSGRRRRPRCPPPWRTRPRAR